MVEIELDYLYETGRTDIRADIVLSGRRAATGLSRSGLVFGAAVDHAGSLTWMRDPFHRLIVGNAAAEGARLLTADRTILKHFRGAIFH